MSTRAEAALVRRLTAGLRAAADPERRAHTLGYFPTRMEILGVGAPELKKLLRPLARSLKDQPPAVVLGVARALLDAGVHEARQLAYLVVGGRRDVIAGADAATVERLGEGNDNWASVDGFGVYVAGPAWRDGRVVDGDVLRWAASPDRWWRRTALVCTVALNVKARGGSGDPERTLRVCEALAADREPMVAKALSWALRALVRVDAGAVRGFLEAHDDELPALVRREVVSKLETGRKQPARRSRNRIQRRTQR